MALKVFIPTPKTLFATANLQTGDVHLNPEWYLYFSEKLKADSLLGGGTFSLDQNILTNQSFGDHVPPPTMSNWADAQNVISQSAFRPHAPPVLIWADDDNILANQIFGG